MGEGLAKDLTFVALWTGIIVLTCLGGGGGGVLVGMLTKLWLSSKPEKPTFGGENFSITISKRWLLWGFAIVGLTIAATAFFFLFCKAVFIELPGYI